MNKDYLNEEICIICYHQNNSNNLNLYIKVYIYNNYYKMIIIKDLKDYINFDINKGIKKIIINNSDNYFDELHKKINLKKENTYLIKIIKKI